MGQIVELAGCDLLTISPGLLGELKASTAKIERKLDEAVAKKDFVTLRSSDWRFLGVFALLRFKPRRGLGGKLRRVVGDGFMGFLVCFLYPIGCG